MKELIEQIYYLGYHVRLKIYFDESNDYVVCYWIAERLDKEKPNPLLRNKHHIMEDNTIIVELLKELKEFIIKRNS